MPASRRPARAARGSRARALLLALALGGPACKGSAPPPRVPTAAEAGSEQVVVNYAPPKLRVLPIATPGAGPAEARYLILGSERPGLPAIFRPLGVTERKAPVGAASRAGALAWVDGHVVEVAPPAPGAGAADTLTLQVFDRDAKVPRPRAVPIGCSGHGQPLLASDSTTLWALVRCGDAAIVLTLDGEGGVRARREVPGGGAAELFLPSGEDFYVLAGPKVLRSAPGGPSAIGTVPGPGGGSETRELVRAGELLLIVDGAAGRVSALDAAGLGSRYEQRFVSGPIGRLRAAASGERLLIAWAEPRADEQSEIVALALPLGARGDRAPQRVLLGSGPARSDHELVPVPPSDGGGALLVRTHASNTGPLVALLHVKL